MSIGDRASAFLDRKLVESLNISFKVQASLSETHNRGKKASLYPKTKKSMRYNRIRKETLYSATNADSKGGSRCNIILKKVVRYGHILKVIESFLGEKWDYTKVLKFSTLSTGIAAVSDLDWSHSKSSDDSPDESNRSFISKIFAPSSNTIDVDAYKMEFESLEHDIEALSKVKDTLEKDCRRLNSFINSESLTPLINVDMKMLTYLTFKLNCARHGNFHTMMKSAKQEYSKALRDYWDSEKKTIGESIHYYSKAVDSFHTTKSKLHDESVDIIQNSSSSESDQQESLSFINSMIRSDETSSNLLPLPVITHSINILPTDNGYRIRDRSFHPIHKLNTIAPSSSDPSSTMEAKIRQREVDEVISKRMHHTSTLLNSFNDELREKLQSSMNLALNAVRRKYGNIQMLNSSGPSQQLDKLNGLKVRIQHLEELTTSFVTHQENLRKTLHDRNKESLDEINLFSLQRRLSFQARLKDHFEKTEQILIAKRRIQRSYISSPIKSRPIASHLN